MGKSVRLGVIGVGGMGSHHANQILQGHAARIELAAVCDIDPERLAHFDKHPEVRQFSDSRKLIRSGLVDAVLVATPHYFHTSIGIDAMQQGLHLLTEKPISVHKADCERMIAAHKANKKQVFAAMFQMRTLAHYQKIKELVASGELGRLTRMSWIITDWFRSDAYYASGGWRATWAGEGGGVLLNQCPHNLDMLQWILGMPSKVQARCALGRWHKIEVEDDVNAYLEFPNGMTGNFVTTTGEAPGTNRLEIVGERGKLVSEGNVIRYTRNEVSMIEFCRTTPHGFAVPGIWNVEVPVRGEGGSHNIILANFADAILDGKPLIAPAEEGLRSVELANAMLFSSMQGKAVEMPLDGKAYERQLKKLIAGSGSKPKKAVKKIKNVDMNASFK
jgi:predicted dehydrogenase